MTKYDIFISYRRDGGAQYARILQLELEKRGYKVFLDYEELTDGIFSETIKEAIKSTTIFMIVLTENSLERCKNEDDWVRKEILLAIKYNKHIIPVNADNTFNITTNSIPEEIKQVIGLNQHSEVQFGNLLEECIDKMVKNRIANKIAHNRKIAYKPYAIISICLLLTAILLGIFINTQKKETIKDSETTDKIDRLKSNAQEYAKPIEEICKQYINWSNEINHEELKVICKILHDMVKVEGGEFMQGAAPDKNGKYYNLVCKDLETPQIKQNVETFFICKYEVSTEQWNTIMGEKFNIRDALKPMSNVTYYECKEFVKKLSDLTGLNFRLPTEKEWEFAARGGNKPDGTQFSGSDNADNVAWYSNNTNGEPHICDATNSPMYPNNLDLYDMSGNVCEWCDTHFTPYDESISVPDKESMVVRGGYFNSELYELTVYHRDPKNPAEKDYGTGLRIAIGIYINE